MTFFLFVLFLIFSGKITLEILIFGLILALSMTLFCAKYLGYQVKKELLAWRLFPNALFYFITLLYEIIKANMSVIPLIVSAKYEVEPALIHFKSPLKTDLAKVILANSITLTPGTITVELNEEEFTVHCLDSSFSNGLENSVFVTQLKRMEQIALKTQKKRGGQK